jgi:hypothetical protein
MQIFTPPKGLAPPFGFIGENGLLIPGGKTVPSSIMRYPKNTAITNLAVFTRAVEYGFIAAGVTVAALAAYQSITTVLSWLSFRL